MTFTTLLLAALLCARALSQSCDRQDIHSIDSYYIYDYHLSIPLTECSFYDLLSSGDCTFWCIPFTAQLPITIDIYFTESLILEGISTQGTHDGYVSVFGIQYSPNTDTELIPLNTIGLPDANGYTIFFTNPIQAQHLQLVILSSMVSEFSDYYYWHINIIGCRSPSPKSSPNNSSYTNGSTSTYNGPQRNVTVQESVSIEPPVEPSVVIIPTDLVSQLCSDDKTVRVTIIQTLVTTVTVSVPSVVLVSVDDVSSSPRVVGELPNTTVDSIRDYFWPVLGTVVVFIIILIIFVTALVIMGIWKNKDQIRRRRSTLLEVQNVNMYELEDSTNTLTRPSSYVINTQPVQKADNKDDDHLRTPLISGSNQYDELSGYRLPADAIDPPGPPVPPRRTTSSDKQYINTNRQYTNIDD